MVRCRLSTRPAFVSSSAELERSDRARPKAGALEGVQPNGLPVHSTRACLRPYGRLQRTTADGCALSPWHGSVFRLSDGANVRGPATSPQPAFDTGVVDGHMDIRPRREHGTQRPDEREAHEAPTQEEEEVDRGRSI
ncbi:hypothetical protein GCM10017668_01060 [Streptomyces tuirus]|uniref:Rieske domain-containing protein n=1 Tax=Streptomyces tuirus TaxID=68278 RepID=A0A7G1N5E0_9ACTN|nr:hypothetical protein GCM10017668_01060 [Streptomyces tuirus]